MVEIIWKPTLHQFRTCREFAEEFQLTAQDLILTNEYIYQPYFGQMNLGCHVLFQEKYGSGEPTDVMVDAILADAARTGCKRVIAIGGGTVIDIAKVLAVSDGEGVDALYDRAPNLEKKRELVILPTTCGTGSEVTNISIMARTRLGTKLGLVSPAMYADHAVLIPQLLEGLPFGVFATSSIDALVHAVESALSPKATPYTKLFGYKAIEMIIRGYQKIAAEGREARIPLLEDFLLASNYAGLAFGTAGCAAVHATSYPLGGKYHIAHGVSNAILLAPVMRFNAQDPAFRERLALAYDRCCHEKVKCETVDEKSAWMIAKMEGIVKHLEIPTSLKEFGVPASDLEGLVAAGMQVQRLLVNNMRHVTAEDARKLYLEIM